MCCEHKPYVRLNDLGRSHLRVSLASSALALLFVLICVKTRVVEGDVGGVARLSGPLRGCKLTASTLTTGALVASNSTGTSGDFSLSFLGASDDVYMVSTTLGATCVDVFKALPSPIQLDAALPLGLTSASLDHFSSTALSFLLLGNPTTPINSTTSSAANNATFVRATASTLYITFGINSSIYSMDPLTLQPFAMLPSSQASNRSFAVAVLGADAELSALAHLGTALLSSWAVHGNASSIRAKVDNSTLARVLMAEGMRELLRLQALQEQQQAATAAAEAEAAAAAVAAATSGASPAPSPALSLAFSEPLGGLYNATVVMRVLNASALRAGIAVPAYALNETAQVVAGVASYAEGIKAVALREMAGEELGLNPLNAVIMMARLAAVQADAASRVPLLVNNSRALDTYMLDALPERISKSVVNVSAIHTTLGLPAPAPPGPSSGAAHVVGPLQGCAGQTNGVWAPEYESFTTVASGAFSLHSKSQAVAAISSYRECIDALSMLELDMTVYNLGPAMPEISVSPVAMLAQGFYMMEAMAKLATLTVAQQSAAFAAMRLDMAAYNAFMMQPPSGGTASSPPPPSPSTSNASNTSSFNLSNPLMGSVMAANVQLLGIYYSSKALFARSCGYAYSIDNSEDYSEFTVLLTVLGVTVQAARAGGVLDLAQEDQVNNIFKFVATACYFNSSQYNTSESTRPSRTGVFLSGGSGSALGGVDNRRRLASSGQQQQHSPSSEQEATRCPGHEEEQRPTELAHLGSTPQALQRRLRGHPVRLRPLHRLLTGLLAENPDGRHWDIFLELASHGVMLGARGSALQQLMRDSLQGTTAAATAAAAAAVSPGAGPSDEVDELGLQEPGHQGRWRDEIQRRERRDGDAKRREESGHGGGDQGGAGGSASGGRRFLTVWVDDPDMISVYTSVTDILIGINAKLLAVQNASTAAAANPANLAAYNLTDLVVQTTQLGVIVQNKLYNELNTAIAKTYPSGLALVTVIQAIVVRYKGAALQTRMNEVAYNKSLVCSAEGSQCYTPPPSPPPLPSSSGGPGTNSGDGSSSLSTAAIVGIVLGAVGASILVVGCCMVYMRRRQVKQSVVNTIETRDMNNMNLRQASTLSSNPLHNTLSARASMTMRQAPGHGQGEFQSLVPAALATNPSMAMNYPLYPTASGAVGAGALNISSSMNASMLSGPRISAVTPNLNGTMSMTQRAGMQSALPPSRFTAAAANINDAPAPNSPRASPSGQQKPLGYVPPGVQQSPSGLHAEQAYNTNGGDARPAGFKTYPNSAYLSYSGAAPAAGGIMGDAGLNASIGRGSQFHPAYQLAANPSAQPQGAANGAQPPAASNALLSSVNQSNSVPMLPGLGSGGAAGGGLNGTMGRRAGLPPLVPYTSVTNADAPTSALNASLRAIPVNTHFNSSLRPPPVPGS